MDDTLETTGILTVGQLKKFIADLPDDVQVVLDDNDGWFINVSHVHKPVKFDGEYTDYSCLTFMFGETFDSRQI
jgi:hypothetical protein